MRAIYGRKLRSPAPYVARFDGHRRSAAAIIYDCKQVLWQVCTSAPRRRPRGEKMTMCCAHRLTPAGVQDELERDAGDLWRCVGRGRTARGRRRHDQDSGAKAHAAGAMSSAQCPSVTMHASSWHSHITGPHAGTPARRAPRAAFTLSARRSRVVQAKVSLATPGCRHDRESKARFRDDGHAAAARARCRSYSPLEVLSIEPESGCVCNTALSSESNDSLETIRTTRRSCRRR
jgi:hypothetical protein